MVRGIPGKVKHLQLFFQKGRDINRREDMTNLDTAQDMGGLCSLCYATQLNYARL